MTRSDARERGPRCWSFVVTAEHALHRKTLSPIELGCLPTIYGCRDRSGDVIRKDRPLGCWRGSLRWEMLTHGIRTFHRLAASTCSANQGRRSRRANWFICSEKPGRWAISALSFAARLQSERRSTRWSRGRANERREYRQSILQGEQRRGTHVLLECKTASYTSRLSLRARRSQKITRDCATRESISFGGTSKSDPKNYRILLFAQRIKVWPGASSVRRWMTLTFRVSGEEVAEGLDVGQGSWRSVKIRERIPLRRDGSNWT